MANLPSDPVARARAEATRLDARVREAQEASTAGDIGAAEAALAAYSTIVVDAADETAGDTTAGAAIELAVARHVVVLTLLVDTVPAAARGAVERALTSSTKALDYLDTFGKSGGDATDPTHPTHPLTPAGGIDPVTDHTVGAAAPVQSTDPGLAPAPTTSPDPGKTSGQGKGPDPAKSSKSPDPTPPAASPVPPRTHKPSTPPGSDSNPGVVDKASQ
jgi:hypothetical protein